MRIYDLDYTETRNACEHCGFSCFDDEIRCPNCGLNRESLLGEDVLERERKLKDYRYKYEVLRKASKRGRILFWMFLCSDALILVSAFVFFRLVRGDYSGDVVLLSAASRNLLLIALLYLLALGQAGLQYTRMKDMRFTPFRFARGLLRRIRDGRAAEAVYAIALFLIVSAIITNYADGLYTNYYYKLKVMVSKEFYLFVGMISLYVTNFLWFAWYFFGNVLCPYDYESELKSRLQEWRK